MVRVSGKIDPSIEVSPIGGGDGAAQARRHNDDEHIGQMIARFERAVQTNRAGDQLPCLPPFIGSGRNQTLRTGKDVHDAVEQARLPG